MYLITEYYRNKHYALRENATCKFILYVRQARRIRFSLVVIIIGVVARKSYLVPAGSGMFIGM